MVIRHALLSPSAAHRWLKCPPSALLCAKTDDSGSEYAAQGTDAHSLCEYRLKCALKRKGRDPTENLQYFDQEMSDCADAYTNFVMELYGTAKAQCKDPIVLIEEKLDFSEWISSEGFGTGDCVIAADDTLYVIDFKYGVGVPISAEMNPQLLCYALGALRLFDGIYDIETISVSVFQPRRDNADTYTLTKAKLLDWAENTLKPIALLAAKGEGEFRAGEHCQFCKVKQTCRKRAEYSLELARFDFEQPAMLDDGEIAEILSKADELTAWVSDVKDYALQQALSGKEYDGWKLVEGRSNRKYVNEDVVADVVNKAGYDPYERKVLGITAMTKMLGRTKFDELLGGYIEKPTGKPVLVSITDKRPAMNTAANDFKEDNNE